MMAVLPRRLSVSLFALFSFGLRHGGECDTTPTVHEPRAAHRTRSVPSWSLVECVFSFFFLSFLAVCAYRLDCALVVPIQLIVVSEWSLGRSVARGRVRDGVAAAEQQGRLGATAQQRQQET